LRRRMEGSAGYVAVIAGRGSGYLADKLYLSALRPDPAAAAPCAAGVGPRAVDKPTQGSPGRVVASQTVSSHGDGGAWAPKSNA